MNNDEQEYLNKFESQVADVLLKLCTAAHYLDGVILESDDINERWHELAPEYMADAVPQVQDYPTFAIICASYLGMAVAQGWHTHWETARLASYKSYYGDRGFDNMDDHIMADVLGLPLDGDEAQHLTKVLCTCAEGAESLLRHEKIDPGTPMAYYAFIRVCRTMFRIGESLQLHRLGYSWEKVN